jgi:hypothetical protein
LERAGDWLATIQRPDGSVGVSAAVAEPGWATPLAVLVWSASDRWQDRSLAGRRWLVACKGRTLSHSDDPLHIAGHDTSLVGWPWVAETHSWLEPTAMAVLALRRAGMSNHERAREGVRLIRDRELDTGGWNYGNKSVFGRSLRAQPGPTGLASLALSGAGPRSEGIARAILYLHAVLPEVRAASSLSWGVIGLRAWGEDVQPSAPWLAESFETVTGMRDAAPKLACLLLASGAGTLALFRPKDARLEEPSLSGGSE